MIVLDILYYNTIRENSIIKNNKNTIRFKRWLWFIPASLQGTWRDGKGLEIYTADFEFESGHAPLVRAWNSQGFTRSPEPTKCTFWEVGFPRIQKKKKDLYQQPKLGTLSTWLNMALSVESIITHLLQLQTYNVNKIKLNCRHKLPIREPNEI